MSETCFLVLGDGAYYRGQEFGSPSPAIESLCNVDISVKSAGEVVFNTGMAGYHEILTDPSYTGQIVTMTYPMIGNYGSLDEWSEIGPEAPERSGIKAAGLVVRQLYRGPIPAGRITLDEFLKRHDTPGITDIDTRHLTLKIRDEGAPNGVIVRASLGSNHLKKRELDFCLQVLADFPPMIGRNLISNVGASDPVTYNDGGSPHLLLVDCGIKANIIRELVKLGCRVSILPSGASKEDVGNVGADALLFSSGPGDPAVLRSQIELIASFLPLMPVFGICLGHQLISQALGAQTRKMKFGHHGVNHPVRDELTNRVFVTSQNHGFVVDEESLPHDVDVWFRNANDNSIEGIRHRSLPVLCAQFHPEAAPGPRDCIWIFKEFLRVIEDHMGKE
ncbi:MAG: carbamoyl phosphate synthase small subunit [Spirochaetales bacterium]|nr:carbamoyl phosphate synthase small subunit [Spirochaetales bacterium]